MYKNKRKLISVILTLAILVGLTAAIPMTASAMNATALATHINDFYLPEAGYSPFKATPNVEYNGQVVVTGYSDEMDVTLNLPIDSGVTVCWKAVCEGSNSNAMISISGSGTFEMSSGEITNYGTGACLQAYGGPSLHILGGAVSALGIRNLSILSGNAIEISSKASSLKITSGVVRSVDGYAVYQTGGAAEIQGGEISSENSIAYYYYAGTALTITGGTIRSSSSNAIRQGTGVDIGVNISGSSRVFGCGTVISGVGVNAADLSVINWYGYGITTPSIANPAVVCGWNKASGKTSYESGTSEDLITNDPSATAKWNTFGGDPGVSLANGSNSGFILISGVTVTAPKPKSVTVGAQAGPLAAGTAGTVTFPIATANIDNGKTGLVSWFTTAAGNTAGAAPAGITAVVANVASNAATVTMTATAAAVAGTYYFKITIDGATSAVATLVVGAAKTVTLAAQAGSLSPGTAGTVTFPVTTAGIENGKAGAVAWFTDTAGATAGTAPAGITAAVSNVASNAATVTMTATAAAVAGTYYFKVTIDGATSAVATLVVGAAKTVTVAAQAGPLTAGTAGTVTFPVTTANIENDKAGAVEWFNDEAGTVAGAAPVGITAAVSNVASNAATVTITATETAVAGTYYFKVTIDEATSGVATLTIATVASGDMANFVKSRTYTLSLFTDIDENEWYGVNGQKFISTAYEYNLVNGMGGTTFAPGSNFSVMQAIALASRIHSIYTTGNDIVQGEPWYQAFLDYATANGIITAGQFTDLDRACTRGEMAYLFSRSLPAEEFAAINTVNSLPDVSASTQYSAEIFMLYRAGVIAGNDDNGTFTPNSNMTRAHAAGIANKIIIPADRTSGKTFG